jgi:hypothetical protein
VGDPLSDFAAHGVEEIGSNPAASAEEEIYACLGAIPDFWPVYPPSMGCPLRTECSFM